MSETTYQLIQQLGGADVLRAMLGSTWILLGDGSVQFDVKGCKKINRVTIQYVKHSDLYRLQFCRYRPATLDLKMIREYDGVYCDQLVALIEQETQLLLSIADRKNQPASRLSG